MQDTGFKMQDSGRRVSPSGHSGFKIQVEESRLADIQDSGFGIHLHYFHFSQPRKGRCTPSRYFGRGK